MPKKCEQELVSGPLVIPMAGLDITPIIKPGEAPVMFDPESVNSHRQPIRSFVHPLNAGPSFPAHWLLFKTNFLSNTLEKVRDRIAVLIKSGSVADKDLSKASHAVPRSAAGISAVRVVLEIVA